MTATIATVSSLAKETGKVLTAGSNETSSNRGSKENICSNSISLTESRICTTKLLCHEGGQE